MRHTQTHVFVLPCLLIALISLSVPAPVRGQVDDFTVGQFNDAINQSREFFRQNGASAAAMRQRGPSFNQKINKARAEYWKQVATGQKDDDVTRRFADLLAEKDIMLMVMSFFDEAARKGLEAYDGTRDVMHTRLDHTDVLDGMWSLTLRAFDHGIRPLATHKFIRWRQAVLRRRDQHQPETNALAKLLMDVPTAQAALSASIMAKDPEFEAYLKARGRAEMLAALDELSFPTAGAYLLKRLELEIGDRPAALQWYQDLEAMVGARRMEQLARQLREAEKDHDGYVAKPVLVDAEHDRELWLTTTQHIERAAALGDAKLYALWLIHRQQEVNWTEAQQIYQDWWVKPFGEQRVLEAAEKVRSAPKTVSPRRTEVLVQDIAGRRDPEYALAYLMPYFPYRDKPLGSLTSTDPQQYLYALVKHGQGIEHWIDVYEKYEAFAERWGEQTLTDAAQKLIEAKKDARGRLAAPAEVGVQSADPWEALEQLLARALENPEGYFFSLTSAEWRWGGTDNNQYNRRRAEKEYEHLVHSFGQQAVAQVIARVRAAAGQPGGLAKLKGNISGSDKPLPVIYETLWSTASPEVYLGYLSRLGSFEQIYFKQYGREATLAAVAKLVRAPKQLDSLDQVHENRGNVLLADRASVGLWETKPTQQGGERSVVGCLSDLLTQGPEPALAWSEAKYIHSDLFRQDGEILRCFEGDQGPQYLVNQNGRVFWMAHENLIDKWRPVRKLSAPLSQSSKFVPNSPWPDGAKVRVNVDNTWHDGQIVFYEGRGLKPVWAVKYDAEPEPGLRLFERQMIQASAQSTPAAAGAPATPSAPQHKQDHANPFPVGSTVQFTPPYTAGRPLVRGFVKDYDPRRGWFVEYQRGSRTVQQWCNSFFVEHSGMTRVTEASETTQPAAADEPASSAAAAGPAEKAPEAADFPVGSAVQLMYGGQMCRGVVKDYNPRSGWLVEFEYRARVIHMRIRPNAVEQYHMTLIEDASK